MSEGGGKEDKGGTVTRVLTKDVCEVLIKSKEPLTLEQIVSDLEKKWPTIKPGTLSRRVLDVVTVAQAASVISGDADGYMWSYDSKSETALTTASKDAARSIENTERGSLRNGLGYFTNAQEMPSYAGVPKESLLDAYGKHKVLMAVLEEPVVENQTVRLDMNPEDPPFIVLKGEDCVEKGKDPVSVEGQCPTADYGRDGESADLSRLQESEK